MHAYKHACFMLERIRPPFFQVMHRQGIGLLAQAESPRFRPISCSNIEQDYQISIFRWLQGNFWNVCILILKEMEDCFLNGIFSSQNMIIYLSFNLSSFLGLLKWTVSRELRHWLLYIIRKLFSRPIVASHKIYILLKGQFTINKKPFSVS